jgi:hypothetical protein
MPATLTIPTDDADGKYTVSWAAVTGATYYVLDSNDTEAGTTVYPAWVNVYSGDVNKYDEYVGGGTWIYRVKACNTCGCSEWNVANGTIVAKCLKNAATGFADWGKYRHPRCWCFKRHCNGDIDGKSKLVGGWVSSDDLAIFKTAYTLSVVQLRDLPCVVGTTGRICGFCADLDHKNKLVGGRVSSDDLGFFKTYYTLPVGSIPCCDTAAPAGDCTLVAGDPFNYWTN